MIANLYSRWRMAPLQTAVVTGATAQTSYRVTVAREADISSNMLRQGHRNADRSHGEDDAEC